MARVGKNGPISFVQCFAIFTDGNWSPQEVVVVNNCVFGAASKVAKVAKASAKGRPHVTGAAPEINKKASIKFAT